MREMTRTGLALTCAIMLLGGLLASCAGTTTTSSPPPSYRVRACAGGAAAGSGAASTGTAGLAPVYISEVGGTLLALSPDSGATLWCDQITLVNFSQATACGNHSCPPPPVIQPGQSLVTPSALYVCVSGWMGVTFALNPRTGAPRWSQRTGCMVTGRGFRDNALPVLAGATLYSGDYALNASDGAVRWPLPEDFTPALVDGPALYAYTTSAVAAFDAQTGQTLWRYTLPDELASLPALANGVLYVGDIGGDSPPAATPDQPDTFALDARTGKLLWRAPTGIASGSPVVVGGVVYVGGFGPAMFAVDATNGHIIWRDNTAYARPTTPAVQDGVVYFTADGIYAVDAATGHIRWRQALGADQSVAFTDVALTHSALYLGRTNGSGGSALYALNPSDGAILWQRSGLNQVGSPVAPA
ncbi:MAG TPA: PQQ-binding-like beta-propeller repeat protein [Ktedonobacterales bacterium]